MGFRALGSRTGAARLRQVLGSVAPHPHRAIEGADVALAQVYPRRKELRLYLSGEQRGNDTRSPWLRDVTSAQSSTVWVAL